MPNTSSGEPYSDSNHFASLENKLESQIVTSEEVVQGFNAKEKIRVFFRNLSEFSELPTSEVNDLSDSCRLVTYGPGEYLTTEGEEENSHGFVPISGLVSLLKTSANGKILVVELLKAGDIFDLLLMLAKDKLPSQLSARSIQRVEAIWVPMRMFNATLAKHPAIFKDIIAHLLICLQSSYNLSRGLAHDRVEVRIAATLTSLALKFPRPLGPGKLTTINFTRQQLADLTGTTSETAIRVTRAMQRDGLIDIKRPGIIKIVNLKRLQEISDI